MGGLKGEKAEVAEQERGIMEIIMVSVTCVWGSEAEQRGKKDKQSQRA